MATFNSAGFNINYDLVEGQGSSQAVFIHGNLASVEWWHPTAELLQNDQSVGKVLMADWRGYGHSKGINNKEEIDFQLFADDYIRLIEDQQMTNVDIVGHSTGGLIALLAVLKRPELFRSCVLLDSVGVKGIIPPVPLDQLLIHFSTMEQNESYCRDVLAATIEGMDKESDVFKRLFSITWECDKPMWTGVIEKLCTEIDIKDQVSKLKLPTLVLHGEKDLVLPITGSQELHELIEGSQFKTLMGQGHSYNMEDPEGFSKELLNFWNSL